MKKVHFGISLVYLFLKKEIINEFISVFKKEILKYSNGEVEYEYHLVKEPLKRGLGSDTDFKYIGPTENILEVFINLRSKDYIISKEEYDDLYMDWKFCHRGRCYHNNIGWRKGKWNHCVEKAFTETKKLLKIKSFTRVDGIGTEELPFAPLRKEAFGS